MISNAENIRTYMMLLEANYERPHDGDPNVDYVETGAKKGEVTKVVANLSSFASGKYSRLAKNIARMQKIAQETLELESSIKADARETIADLFAAEDAAYTRVVETVSFTLQITKDPKAATTVSYVKVLEELQQHLTPELIKVLESIKAKFSTVNAPKPPSLTHSAKEDGVGYDEGISESPMLSKMSEFFKKYLNKIISWGETYDQRLAALKSQIGVTESRIHISEDSTDPNRIIQNVWSAMSQQGSLELIGGGPKGASMTVGSNGSVFEISVRQVS
jgi:glutamyl/glutaminyl-tRNA synthetase